MTRNQYNEDERMYVTMIDSNGDPLTGAVDVLISIRRDSDSYWYDFSDNTFKVSGWTSSSQAMTELDAINTAGTYYYDLDTTFGIFGSQQNYLIQADCASAVSTPQHGYLKLGGWIDSVGLVGGGGSGMTAEQAQDIAERVWKVILKGKQTAKDVLLRKSEFDATKDYVLTTKDADLADLIKKVREDIKKIKFPDNSDKIIKALDKLKPIDFNPILGKVLDKISLTVSFFNQGKNDIIKSIESQEKPKEYDDSKMMACMEECKMMVEMMKDDMAERMECMKMMNEGMKEKEEEMGKGHKEKMEEIMNKMEKQAEENQKNIKKILLKMTELKFDSDNSNIEDFEWIKDSLSLILDRLEV